MFSHERFRELSAAAAIGYLSREEARELEQHLLECESCCEACGEYEHLVRHFLPQAKGVTSAGSAALTSKLAAERRERFFSRVRNEGVNLSKEAELATPGRSGFSLHTRPLRAVTGQMTRFLGAYKPALSAAALVLLVISAGWFSRLDQSSEGATTPGPANAVKHNDDLRADVAGLREQVAKQAAQIESSEKVLAALRNSRAKLSNTNQAKDASIAVLSAENERMARERNDYLITKEVVDSHLANVTHELAETRGTLDRVSQLLTVTPDVLRLMGAKKLHIVDVHDFDESGRSVRAFGRIFYAEDQAFVFYAFDLSSGGLGTGATTFHAWGQREAESNSPRKLGTFTFDRERRRWVLQVKDPALLAGMDHVFVSADGPDDGKQPTGRKLLYAYIGGEPNHP